MDRSISWTGAAVVPVLAFFVLPQQAAAEGALKWTPFVAKQSVRTYEITSAGKRCTSEKTGIYMQDSHGSTYTRTIAVSGDFGGEADDGVLDDAPTGITYTIDYSRKQARVTRKPPPGPFEPKRPETGDYLKQYTGDQLLGKRTISGVECLGFKVPVMGSDEVAETWLAPSLNFFPVLARMYPAPGVELVVLLEGIRVGEEPDAQFFRIPEGFTVVE